MGTVLRFKSVHFCVHSREHQPPHVHVRGPGFHFRVSLLTIEILEDAVPLRKPFVDTILGLVEANRELFLNEWKKYHETKEEN